ncbi:MAG: VOC family protein [Leptolyngbyaceae bacterium]|nr:VOC family protein [Leptolyngbyaceae bacterium]
MTTHPSPSTHPPTSTSSPAHAPSPSATESVPPSLPSGHLKGVHHIALHVTDLNASRHFYGRVLGLHELVGDEVPSTLKSLFLNGEIANFRLPDGTILDLFSKPNHHPPHPDPAQEFTRFGHLAFEIAPELFDEAVRVLHEHHIPIDHGPVSRPTGRGIYFYDPDGVLLEIRCDPS